MKKSWQFICIIICLLFINEAVSETQVENGKSLTVPDENIPEIGIGSPENKGATNNTNIKDKDKSEDHGGIHLVSWRWGTFSRLILFTLMIICAGFIKIAFHHTKYLSRFVPESCVLILLGIILAVFNHYILEIDKLEDNPYPKFTADLFFNVLLPPVILDSAFALYDRDFLSNISAVLTFAVAGTLFNVFTVGFTLYGLVQSGVLGEFDQALSGVQCLIFSSLISAVDPVAVLAIFEEIQVNTSLYFLVFGESLLNDGVTVVLYNTMIAIGDSSVGPTEVIMAILSFFFVVFGGFTIGLIGGAIASMVTRLTMKVRVVEPLLILSLGYLSFLFAELLHWSGIISIIGYGLVVKRYAFTNISKKSYTTVKYAIKTLSSLSDCIIFLFLGIVLISEEHNFHIGFIIATILVCTLFRFVGTFFLSWLVNFKRTRQISIEEQFIMAYGGLRGAVGFSLACVLTTDVWYRQLFLSTALIMVFFTVFLQGSTIKLLVKVFRIRLKTQQEGPRLISPHIQDKLIDDVMAGIEVVLGQQGTYTLHERFRQLDQSCLRPVLLASDKREGLEREYEKVLLDNHFTHLYGAGVLVDCDVENTQEFSMGEDLKIFKKGIKESPWGKYMNKFDKEMTSDETTIRGYMKNRIERANNIQSNLLRHQAQVQKTEDEEAKKDLLLTPLIRDRYRESRAHKEMLMERSARNTPVPP